MMSLTLSRKVWVRMFKSLPEQNKILIIQTAFIGDAILTTPLIRYVKGCFPHARLDVLVIPQTKSVLENNPHIHTLFTFDKRGDKKKAFRETVSKLRAESYDLCFSPHRSLTSARLAAKAQIPYRIGFGGQIPSLFYHKRVPFDRKKSQINRYLDLLRIFKDEEYDIQTELFFTDQEIDFAHSVFQSFPLSKKIAIAPGSVWLTKRWPEERFTELVEILGRQDVALVFIGSADERALCERIGQQTKTGNIFNLAGKTTLLQAAAVIQSCDLLICNDSGAMHMANAVGTDVFVFFGPTVQRFGFAPFRPQDIVFEVDEDCRPCSSHGGKKCPQKHFRCMRSITVENVYEHVVKRLDL